jgi:hypothetical protein
MKRNKKKRFLSELKRVPIVSSVCEKVGLSRNTIYRWLKEDVEFKKAMNRCLHFGKESVNDLAESALINLIQQGELGAVKYWLGNNKRNYVRPILHDVWNKEEDMSKRVDKIQAVIYSAREEIEKVKELNEQLEKKQKWWDERYSRLPGSDKKQKPLDE